jgi:hypothetical protein
MLYNVIRVEPFRRDAKDALDYYDDISNELGERFERGVQHAFNQLSEHPHHYFNLKYGYRRIRIEGFPYMMVYTIDENNFTVKVFGLFHQHSKPSAMYKKIKKR